VLLTGQVRRRVSRDDPGLAIWRRLTTAIAYSTRFKSSPSSPGEHLAERDPLLAVVQLGCHREQQPLAGRTVLLNEPFEAAEIDRPVGGETGGSEQRDPGRAEEVVDRTSCRVERELCGQPARRRPGGARTTDTGGCRRCPARAAARLLAPPAAGAPRPDGLARPHEPAAAVGAPRAPAPTAGAMGAVRPRLEVGSEPGVSFPIVGQRDGQPRAPPRQSEPATVRPRRRAPRAASRPARTARSLGRARQTAACGSKGRSSRSAAATAPLVRQDSLTHRSRRSRTTIVRLTRPSFAPSLLRGRLTSHSPTSEHDTDYAGRWPLPASEPPQRLLAAAAGVGARPVVGRRPSAVTLAPFQHRRGHQLRRPAPLDRAGMTALTAHVGVALAVPRLRVRAAATTHADNGP
jgi:hypothetical protein